MLVFAHELIAPESLNYICTKLKYSFLNSYTIWVVLFSQVKRLKLVTCQTHNCPSRKINRNNQTFDLSNNRILGNFLFKKHTNVGFNFWGFGRIFNYSVQKCIETDLQRCNFMAIRPHNARYEHDNSSVMLTIVKHIFTDI